MNVPSFIGLSTVILLTWLGAAYFHEIPHERYPKQGRLSSNTPESKEAAATLLVNVSSTDESQ